jgi:integral membrane protein (TIGR01906 family)
VSTSPPTTQISPKTISPIYRVLSWLVTFLIPVALTLTVVRIMLSPLYVWIEYKIPGFPVDSYGFTDEERYKYAQNARQYLVNAADISFLGDLRFQDGQPVYYERELSHMVDVKNTVKAVLNVWLLSLALLVGLGIWAWFGNWRKEYTSALGRGGWLTVLLMGTILVFVAISFGYVFVAFHNVFFQPGTWTFQYSDTLIRLFPERFWRDLFIAVGGLSILGGVTIGLLFGRARK